MRKYFLALACCMQTMISLHAQVLQGLVSDRETGEALPYVSIGVPHRDIGTVAQGDGTFRIVLPDDMQNDSLRFSMVGYQTLSFRIGDLAAKFPNGDPLIRMTKNVQELTEVEIRPREVKEVTLGNTFNSPAVSAGFETDDLGSELGTIMRVKKGKKYYLKGAVFNIAKCQYDSILFRVNIYSYEHGEVGPLMHSLPIYVKCVRDQNRMVVNLDPYSIVMEDDFILSLEWIMDLPDKTTSFMFCAGLFGNRLLYRKTSEGDWRSIPVGVGSYVVADMEK